MGDARTKEVWTPQDIAREISSHCLEYIAQRSLNSQDGTSFVAHNAMYVTSSGPKTGDVVFRFLKEDGRMSVRSSAEGITLDQVVIQESREIKEALEKQEVTIMYTCGLENGRTHIEFQGIKGVDTWQMKGTPDIEERVSGIPLDQEGMSAPEIPLPAEMPVPETQKRLVPVLDVLREYVPDYKGKPAKEIGIAVNPLRVLLNREDWYNQLPKDGNSRMILESNVWRIHDTIARSKSRAIHQGGLYGPDKYPAPERAELPEESDAGVGQGEKLSDIGGIVKGTPAKVSPKTDLPEGRYPLMDILTEYAPEGEGRGSQFYHRYQTRVSYEVKRAGLWEDIKAQNKGKTKSFTVDDGLRQRIYAALDEIAEEKTGFRPRKKEGKQDKAEDKGKAPEKDETKPDKIDPEPDHAAPEPAPSDEAETLVKPAHTTFDAATLLVRSPQRPEPMPIKEADRPSMDDKWVRSIDDIIKSGAVPLRGAIYSILPFYCRSDGAGEIRQEMSEFARNLAGKGIVSVVGDAAFVQRDKANDFYTLVLNEFGKHLRQLKAYNPGHQIDMSFRPSDIRKMIEMITNKITGKKVSANEVMGAMGTYRQFRHISNLVNEMKEAYDSTVNCLLKEILRADAIAMLKDHKIWNYNEVLEQHSDEISSGNTYYQGKVIRLARFTQFRNNKPWVFFDLPRSLSPNSWGYIQREKQERKGNEHGMSTEAQNLYKYGIEVVEAQLDVIAHDFNLFVIEKGKGHLLDATLNKARENGFFNMCWKMGYFEKMPYDQHDRR